MNKVAKKIIFSFSFCMFLACVINVLFTGMACATGSGASIYVSGTLVRNVTCSVKGGGEVSFGDAVGINKIDGNYDTKSVNVRVECNGKPSGQVKLAIVGNSVNINNKKALKIDSYDGVGLIFSNSNSAWEINEYQSVTPQNTLTINVSLYKSKDAKIDAGPFSASATLALLVE
jgi:hypothetical protein